MLTNLSKEIFIITTQYKFEPIYNNTGIKNGKTLIKTKVFLMLQDLTSLYSV